VSKHLVTQIERLLSTHKFAASDKAVITSVEPSGLAVHLVTASNWDKQRPAMTKAAMRLTCQLSRQRQPSFAKVEQQDGALRLEVQPQAVAAPGELQFEIDTRDVLAEIMRNAGSLGPNDRVWVKASFVAINGEKIELDTGPARAPVAAPQGLESKDHLKSEAEGVFKCLAVPGFEPIAIRLLGSHLVVEAELRGSASDWAEAQPVLYVDGAAVAASLAVDKAGGLRALRAKLPLIPARKGEITYNRRRLTIEARVTNAAARFDGEAVAISPATFAVDTTTYLSGPTTWSVEGNSIVFHARTHALPNRHDVLKVECTEPGSSPEKPVTAKSASPRKVHGKPNVADYVELRIKSAEDDSGDPLAGALEGAVDTAHLKQGVTYTFKVSATAIGAELFGGSSELVAEYTMPK
jgi:hypothetical protein